MADDSKTEENKTHLKNFKSSTERSADITTRLYNNEICHSVKQVTKEEYDKNEKETC